MLDIVPIPRRSFLIGGTLALVPSLARAQAWPTHPVALIIPFPAGGGTDGSPTAESFRGADRRQDGGGNLSRGAADAPRSGGRPARCRLHFDHEPRAARAGRTAARARRDQRDPHASIARGPDGGAG